MSSRANKKTIVVLAALTLTLGFAYLSWTKPQRLGPLGNEIALALVSACNLKSHERVERLAHQIEQDVRLKRLPVSESRILQDLLELARNEDWSAACALAQKLVRSQQTPNVHLPVLD